MKRNDSDLIGRGTELATIDAVLGALPGGRPATVVLTGEPGIGKSRLLTELGRRADARGMLVLSGSASEFERDLPFWLFVEALDEYLRAVEPVRLTGLTPQVRAELAHILPSWPDEAGARTGHDDPRYRTHRAVSRVLEALSAAAPLVLLLDDVHWADSGSAELICALLRRPPSGPVLVGMALRPRQASHRLAAAIERARTVRLEVGGLSPADARELLGPGVDDRVAGTLYAESGGNPFYLRQLARARTVPPSGERAAASGDEVPAAVTAAIADEIALLDRDTRRVLEGAAVAGDPFLMELAAVAADLPEAAIAEALDELERRDLVRTTEAPRRFRFRHPLVRRAVYDAVPGGWRIGAHARIAAALAGRGVPPAGRAHHVAQAARTGDPAAVDVLRAAGDAAVRRTPGEAARWYRAAIDLSPSAEPGLWAALAGALGTAGEFGAARSALVQAIDLTPDAAVASRVGLIAECARIEHTLGLHDVAHRRLTVALERTGDEHPAESVALINAIALDHLYGLEYGEAQEWSGRARAAAARAGDPQPLAESLAGLALSSVFHGDTAAAAGACTQAAELIDGMTDDQVGGSPDPSVVRLAAAELYAGRLPDAARHAERGHAAARLLGSEHHIPVLYWTGTVWTAAGRLPEATSLLDEAVEVARSAGNASMLGWVLIARSFAALAGGDPATALAAAEESVRAHGAPSRTLPAVWARLALGASLLESGAPARAEQVIGDDGSALLPAPLRAAAYEVLARCRLALGRNAGAAEAAGLARAAAHVSPVAGAVADRCAAAVALHSGDPRRAVDLALGAAAAADRAGAVIEAATARELAARALTQAALPQRAAEELQLACDAFDGCGAPRRRAAAERELRRLGHRTVHHRSRAGAPGVPGVATLTGRELQVARLITDRRTNAEIAAEMYLSPKTVETHVRNLFRKLSVASRVEVARAVERFDAEQGD